MDTQTILWYVGIFFALVLVGWLTRALFRVIRWVLIKITHRNTSTSSD